MSFHDFERIQEKLKSVSDPIGFLTNLFAHSPVGFAVWTPDGRPLLTNPAFMRMFEVEPPPEYNVLKDDLLAASGMLALFQRGFAGETVQVPTFWYDPRELKSVTVREGKRIAMSMTIFPLFKADGRIDYVAATYKDDTELMLAQERLRAEGAAQKALLLQMERHIAESQRLVEERTQIEAQLRQAQKMEALGTLSGGIAHDFNNILTIILGHAEMARNDAGADPQLRRNLDEIHQAGVRASSLVKQILAFGRPQQTQRNLVALQPVVEESLRLLRSSLPAMIEIRKAYAADLPTVQADSHQVQQIMTNLVTNASHALGAKGGILEVRLDAVEVGPELAATAVDLREGLYLRLEVIDNGCGIEKAILQRIFEPFFTTKPPGQGSGLGLSVVHGIMKSHQGAVMVHSEPGKGTTFHLYFPAAGGKAAAKTAPAASAPGRGERILHVDDEEQLTFLTRRLLQKAGYHVTSHTHPESALQDFRSRPRDFDVVITDLSMPGISGLHLVGKILEIRPDTPIILTSGYFRPEDQESADRAGIRELILKPLNLDDLGRSLSRLLDRPKDGAVSDHSAR